MAVNKVVLGENTLIDLTADTVSADKLSKGVTAHNMAGEPIVGTMEAGGGVPDNMVTTDTKQTITGKKIFNTYPEIGSIKNNLNIAWVQNASDGLHLSTNSGNNNFVTLESDNQPRWKTVATPTITKTLATTDQITTVEANPENPTQTLSSIKIGDVDYSVGGGGGGSSYTAGDGITIDSSNVINNNFGKSITCSWFALDDEFTWGYGDYIKEVAATETMSQYLGKCPVIAGSSVYTPDLSLFTDDWATGGRKTLYKYDGTNFTFTATRTDGTYWLASGHVLAKVGRQNWIDCSSIAVFQKYLSRIKYNNTNSGLTATNIPDAIDELNTKITTVEANPENPTQTLSSIKIGDVDYSVGGIPAPPSTDGEYNLHCSIVNGVPTYSWVAE